MGHDTGPVFQSTGPAGHRGRMRERLLDRGAAGLADYEVLEMLLFLGIPRGDTKPRAKELINRFGSLGAVLAASPEALAASGLDRDAILPISLVEPACERLARAETREKKLLNSLELVEAHLRERTLFDGGAPAGPRILFLDNRNRLLGDELAGAPSGVPQALPIRTILRRALALHATALLIADTDGAHPDREAGRQAARLADAAGFLSVTVHDRVALTKAGIVSCRALGLLARPRAHGIAA